MHCSIKNSESDMRKRATLVGILGAVAVALVWWALGEPSVAVRDVRQAEVLVLATKKTDRHPIAISIHCFGQIDGEATITLLVGGQPYRIEKLSGSVDFEWGGDWYSETAKVRYEPVDVRSGKLVLHYSISKL
jgi:hypothetical protein